MTDPLGLTDPRRIGHNIPRSKKVLVFDAVVAFSRLEEAMSQAIRTYLKLTEHEGRIYCDQLGFKAKLARIRRLAGERVDRSEWDRSTNLIWPILEALARDRNWLVHGEIMFVDKRNLVAASNRSGSESDIREGDIFTDQRLRGLRESADSLASTFLEASRLYSHPVHEPLHPILDRTREGLEQAAKSKKGY